MILSIIQLKTLKPVTIFLRWKGVWGIDFQLPHLEKKKKKRSVSIDSFPFISRKDKEKASHYCAYMGLIKLDNTLENIIDSPPPRTVYNGRI